MSLVVILAILAFIVLYIVGYLYSRKYLQEDFAPLTSQEVTIPVQQSSVPPFSTARINDVDDFEYSQVFKGETDRELSQMQRNKLMSQYPMDWSTNPPSSTTFQTGLREMFEDASGSMMPMESPYTAITDDSLKPPADADAIEKEERKILQTYEPKHLKDLTTYDIEDAKELIKKIYDVKGLIPQVVKKPNNVFEVVGTRRKDEKIVYDETCSDAPNTSSKESTPATGENVIQVPQAAVDANAALDPFYESRPTTHQDKWTYRSWTPGLERMFAPTESKSNWY
jgi:uncharacterized protein YneF (UPF0154 family)